MFRRLASRLFSTFFMSAHTATSRSLVVSGLNVTIYCHPSQSVCGAFAPLLPISVLFFLHGRRSSLADVESIIEKVIMMAHSEDRKKDLYIVAIVSTIPPLVTSLSSLTVGAQESWKETR